MPSHLALDPHSIAASPSHGAHHEENPRHHDAHDEHEGEAHFHSHEPHHGDSHHEEPHDAGHTNEQC